MGYRNKFEESDHKALNSIVATKILDLMAKLRNEENDNSQRRWIWELLQNAKDVVIDGQKIDIEIELEEKPENKSISFSHNGKPFSVDNITYLINQVSTKERNKKPENGENKTTGKFGTGFITTHLLSEKVEVRGIAKEPDEEYRPFLLPLDRSGRSEDEIIKSVSESIAIRDALDNQEANIDYNPVALNTSFLYNLDEEGYEVAEIGLKDLQGSLPYTLAFVPIINSVHVKHQNCNYSLSGYEKQTDEIELFSILRKTSEETKEIKIVKLTKGKTSIAIEIENKEGRTFVKPITSLLPKIFCDFPLIGTNNFPFPVIINSSYFNPTEPRDGIWLQEKNTDESQENKSLILDGLELYFQLLSYAIENKWGNLYHLIDMSAPEEKRWLSTTWFEENIQKLIREKLFILPIVELENGEMISIKNLKGKDNIYFPYHSKPEVREKIWELDYVLFPNSLPAKKDVHNWYKLHWKGCFKNDIQVITKYIEDKKSISNLSEEINGESDETIAWLNAYYDLLNLEGKFIDNIINDKYAVIPNQNGEFKKRKSLKVDKGIEEELKNVLKMLGEDPRGYLIYRKVVTGSKIRYSPQTQEDLVGKINAKLNNKNTNYGKAISYLLSLFSQDEDFPKKRKVIYDFCEQLLPDETPEIKYLSKWSEVIWEKCDDPRVTRLIKIISKKLNLKELSVLLDHDDLMQTTDWLNSFIFFLKKEKLKDGLNLEENPILPNQNGDFCIADHLFLDEGDIEEPLKDILESLDYDIRSELLDKRIFLELPENRTRNSIFVSNKITELITPKFSEFPRTENTKKIFNSLYLWFNKNKGGAENLFKELYKNKHKLYDDNEIAANLEKAEIIDKIIDETGLSPEEIESKFKEFMASSKQEIPIDHIEKSNEKFPISSEEDIPISPSLYDETSEKTRISLNQEAKILIFDKLKEKGFIISKDIEIDFTVIENVTAPNGEPVVLVIKSAKAGKIYFNPNEWLALTKANAQLFIVNNNNNVVNVTLTDLEKTNDDFHMRFNMEAFTMTNLESFAEFFKYLPSTHFIFNAPENYADYFEKFGLSERNSKMTDLTPDDKNLLQ